MCLQRTDSEAKTIQFVGSNIINGALRLKIDPMSQLKTIRIHNSLGQVIKTISVLNSLYIIEEDITTLANGVYFITSSKWNAQPLKFIISTR